VVESGTAFTARVDPATAARPGSPLRLALNPGGFHYFDVNTGENRRRRHAASAATPTAY
jgi:hypothetical protein